MPIEKKGEGCYHVHNTTTKKCLSKEKAKKQLAAIEIAKHLHESIMEMFEPFRSPLQNTSYMASREPQPADDYVDDDSDPGIARGEENDAPEDSPYWGRRAAGCLFYAKSTGNVMFGLRSGRVLEPHTWGGFGGKLDGDETPIEGLERELSEEVGYTGMDQYIGVSVFQDPDHDFEYYNYLVVCEDEFEPNLNAETDDYIWTPITNPPEPLHPGLEEAMPYYVSAVRKLRGNR